MNTFPASELVEGMEFFCLFVCLLNPDTQLQPAVAPQLQVVELVNITGGRSVGVVP